MVFIIEAEMKTVAVRNINRTPLDLVNGLAGQGASTVHEAMGRIGIMKPYMRPIYPGAKNCWQCCHYSGSAEAITGWCM